MSDTRVTIYFVSKERVSLEGLDAEEFLKQYYDNGTVSLSLKAEITIEERRWLPELKEHIVTRRSFHRNNFEQVHSSVTENTLQAKQEKLVIAFP